MPLFKTWVGLVVMLTFSNAVLAKDPVVEFSRNAAYSDVQISPDGKYLGVAVYVDDKRALGIIDRSTFKMVHAVRFPGSYQVGQYYWVNNERVVIKMVESEAWSREPAYYGELFAVNWDGSKAEKIYGYSAGEKQVGSNIKKRESTQGWAEIIDILPGNDKQILIASTPWAKGGDRTAELLQLDVYTGRTRKISHAPAPYADFLTDQKGDLALAVSTDSNNERAVYRYSTKSKEWTPISKNKFGYDFHPIAINDSGDGVYVIDDYQQDKTGLFELKFDDFSYREIFTDASVDISDYELTKNNNKVFALKLDDGRPTYALLTDKYTEAKVFKDLLASFDGDALSITSKTDNDQFWVIFSYSDTNPGRYFLYDREKNSLLKLFDRMPNLSGFELAATEPVSFKSFDGREVHGYFTKGKGSDAQKPLVVNVHGGPHGVRDRWGFDSEVQFLANAGYSVLQVNYRGSSGYGNEHILAGYLQWGDAIQRDIISATEWAIAEGKAQAGNVCIIGASFGGYSALQSAIVAPDLYNCAVGVAGVYDLNIMKSEGDIPLLAFGIAYLDQVLGTDQAKLNAYSPVFNVDRLKASVFIAHGMRDKRAPLEHAERLKAALDKAGKEYQWLQFNDETHGFYSPQNREVYYSELLAFLAKHLKK